MFFSIQLLCLILQLLNFSQGSPVPEAASSSSQVSTSAAPSSKSTATSSSISQTSIQNSKSTVFPFFFLTGDPVNKEEARANVTTSGLKTASITGKAISSKSSTSIASTQTDSKNTTSSSKSTSSNSTSNSTAIDTSGSSDTGLCGSEGYETLLLWEVYSQVLTTQKGNLQSLMLKDQYDTLSKYTAFSTDLLKALILGSHKSPTDTQKSLVDKISDNDTTDGSALQSAIYNVSGGFQASWEPSVVYSGLSNYVETYETFNAELPDLIRATEQSKRIPWIKQLYSINSQINNMKFIDFFLKVQNHVTDLNSFGIKYNATSKYVMFTSSSDYTSLDSAVSAYNKKVDSSDLTTDLIREVQITYESSSRLLDLWSNAASAT